MRIFVMKKDTLIRIAAFAIIIAGAVFYTRAVANADEQVFSQTDSGMLNGVSTEDKAVAVTIDTTFGEDKTLELLDVLDSHGAKATFAVMGAWAQENASLVREIAAAGHEIISHSMAHERYDDIGADKAVIDAKAAKEYLKTEFGVDTSIIRPPYGNAGEEITAALRENGLTPVRWTIDSRDWKGDSAEDIAAGVIDEVVPGSIIMFQNNSAGAPEALNMILEALADRAYATVSLSELMSLQNDQPAGTGENA